jgi:hypothetical protein
MAKLEHSYSDKKQTLGKQRSEADRAAASVQSATHQTSASSERAFRIERNHIETHITRKVTFKESKNCFELTAGNFKLATNK